MHGRRKFLGSAVGGAAALGSTAFGNSESIPMRTSPNWIPFSIFYYDASYDGGYAFPQMQRLSRNINHPGGLEPGAEISFPVPYRLFGLTLDTSIQSRGSALAVSGVCVVIGQNGDNLAYSQAIQAPVIHTVFPNAVVCQTTFVEFGPCGLLLPAQTSIALFGFGAVPAAGANGLSAFCALYLAQDS